MQIMRLIADAAPAGSPGRSSWVDVALSVVGGLVTVAVAIVGIIQAKANARVAVLEVKLEHTLEELKESRAENAALKLEVADLRSEAAKKAVRIAVLEQQNADQAQVMTVQAEEIRTLKMEAAQSVAAEDALRIEIEQS